MLIILEVKDRKSEQHGNLVLYDTEWGLLTRQSGKPREFTTRSGARGVRSKVVHDAISRPTYQGRMALQRESGTPIPQK